MCKFCFTLKDSLNNQSITQLKPIEHSKFDTASVYAVTSLFWGKHCNISYFKIRINHFLLL
jgi:hypothetical protein